jgi:DTW domain-containing protein YfiP
MVPEMMPETDCPKCHKEKFLCVCDLIQPARTKLHVLILQHPQEPDKELGSARIANLALANSTLKIGLSWPNLSKALGRPAIHGNWGVLYLGGKSEKSMTRQESYGQLEGIVVLDGTWAQAKTMWWRNPWLLKLKRLILNPSRPSLYGRLRQEPRRECLSTIESIAETLEMLGEDVMVSEALRGYFLELLRRYEAHRSYRSIRSR